MKERPIIFSGPMVRAILGDRKTQSRRIVKLPDNAVDVIYYAPPSGRSQAGWADPGVRYLVPDPEDRLPPGFPDEIEPWPHSLYIDPCPYGQPGDRLYVRERWQYYDWTEDGIPWIRYAADNASILREPDTDEWAERTQDVWATLSESGNFQIDNRARDRRWRPSIHMPKWAARIWLEVTGVRVERVQDISEYDAKAEGLRQVQDGLYSYWRVNEWNASDPDDHAGFSKAVPAFRQLWDSLNAKRAPWDSNPWVWVIEFRKLPTDNTSETTEGSADG